MGTGRSGRSLMVFKRKVGFCCLGQTSQSPLFRFATILLLMVFAGYSAEDPRTSPSGKLFAHYTLCSMQNPCIPEVVITNRNGVETRRFKVRGTDGACASILNVEWVGEKVIAALCHGSPSMNYYLEVELESAKVVREYLGLGFVRSPDDSRWHILAGSRILLRCGTRVIRCRSGILSFILSCQE